MRAKGDTLFPRGKIGAGGGPAETVSATVVLGLWNVRSVGGSMVGCDRCCAQCGPTELWGVRRRLWGYPGSGGLRNCALSNPAMAPNSGAEFGSRSGPVGLPNLAGLLPCGSAAQPPAGGESSGTGWPMSRVLSPAAVARRRVAIIHLGAPLPVPSSGLPGHSGEQPSIVPCLALLRVGFT